VEKRTILKNLAEIAMSLSPFAIGTAAFATVGLTGILGAIFAPKLRNILIPEPKASALSDILSFESVLEDNVTIRGKDGTLTQTIWLKGIDMSIKTPLEVEALMRRKQHWLDSLSETGARFKIITLRSEHKHQLAVGKVSSILTKIHEAWMPQFDKTYSNRHYIVLTHHPKSNMKPWAFFKKETGNLGILKEMTAVTLGLLQEFEASLLDNGEGNFSPLLSFWAELINGRMINVRSYHTRISERLTSSSVVFEEGGTITYVNGEDKQYSGVVSLKIWGEASSQELLKEIESLPGKLVISQLYEAFTPTEAKRFLDIHETQSLLRFSRDKVSAEFKTMRELILNKEASLYTYQISIFVFGEDKASLDQRLDEVRRIFWHYGVVPIIESSAVEWLWRSQFPGIDFMIKFTYPASYNLAYLLSFGKEATGLTKSDWGEGPIRFFKTPSGSGYALQFHVTEEKEALAHSLVVASAGSGKTTLFQHLIGGALRHPHLKAYIFDRFNGTRIFTEAVGGHYIDLSDNRNVPLNPLVCDDTEENRGFLQLFLSMLAHCQDDSGFEEVGIAVEQIFKVPKEERILKNLFQDMASQHGQLRTGLKKWATGSTLARWFNGTLEDREKGFIAYDALNFGENALTAFEMTDVQAIPEVAAAVTTYLMHQIRKQARETASPHLIFIDETKPMLMDPHFSKNVEIMLLEHRKLRGSINLCFQDPNSIMNSSIGSIILKQCPTRFLFPSHAAERKDYEIFNLTDFEWEYIKGINKVSRALKHSVLVKRLNESVILDINLNVLGSLLQLYRSGTEPVQLVRALKQQWGGDRWVEKYLN